MPKDDLQHNKLARRIIDISPDRIPHFINQSIADRTLSETIVALNRQFSAGTKRETELAEEALRRLGFVLEGTGDR